MRRNLLWALASISVLCSGALGQSSPQLQSQSASVFKDLFSFSNGADGCCLYGGVARDQNGNLYGVTYIDNQGTGPGTLYKLIPEVHGYKLQILHDFSFSEGLCITTPTLDREGNLFGVCTDVGTAYGTLWEYSLKNGYFVLHTFGGIADGMEPEDAVVLDGAGNVYGTAYTSGPGGSGTLWEYSPATNAFKILHAFADGNDGGLLPAGPTLDHTGKLWGTTEAGPNCYYCGTGTVWSYDLVSGTFSTVLDFGSSGVNAPQSHFAIDSAGNLYGTAFGLTQANCGLVYELPQSSNYAPVILHSFTGLNGDGCDPFGAVALDDQGNLLGTTYDGGNLDDGVVYKLTQKNGMWTETILHSFTLSDGYRPQSGLTKGKGVWFGTASAGGVYRDGVIFEISE